MTASNPPEIVLDVRDLVTHFATRTGIVKAVDGVSFQVKRGKTLCVVGESGSGKSVTARSILQIVDSPGRIVSGSMVLNRPDGSSVDLAKLHPRGREIRAVRGAEIAMIFQEPMSSLSPVHTVGDQIVEVLRLHLGMDKKAARARTIELLTQVEIPNPSRAIDRYTFEFSGGMRQRAMIAMALVGEPTLLIADEPTTALDVTVQAQILALLADLRDRRRMAILLITHNLGVVAETADEVAVMYAGRIVERAPATSLFRDAQHPYTLALLGAMPESAARGQPLSPIPGRMPAPGAAPPGCRFAPRCPFAGPDCAETPPLREIAQGHAVACHRAPVERGA
jgi:peptide/nickel transport system ATP-binding protein